MREIKFRAWVPNNYKNSNEMIYLGKEEDGQYFDFSTKYNEVVLRESNDQIIENPRYFKLMQFTGLRDKNGKEIYEGDILDAGDRIVIVVWHELGGQWDTDFIRYKGNRSSNGIINTDWKFRTKVIGNIYENPELLEQ